jgi:hypothetical protein
MTGMSGPGETEGEVSGDEAAWRDLVARFDSPATAAADRPWPARESLPDDTWPASPATDTLPAAPATDPVTAQDLPGAQAPGGLKAYEPVQPYEAVQPYEGMQPYEAVPPYEAAQPHEQARVIRPAGDPRSYSPPEEEDEPFVPAPLPPPASLDPIAKAAWAGVICGPAYLLVASLIMHWTISAVDAFLAVAAFIGGFVTLVIKLGDHPRDDDDNGAVL